ncbi:MAG: right-handed parallel beta-helix repeat-containing protein [Chitinophagales bacterium]|nr:right-handed parallel beta-helix repeat-containing protein [Chitinophagales bacterium]
MKNSILFIALAVLIINLSACKSRKPTAESNAELENQLLEKFASAKDGDIIELPEGTITLQRPLIIDGINNITIRGKGKDKTILNFKGQKDGAEGIRITANNILMEDFTVLDAKGDCIKVQDATGVVFRNLKVGWTALHSTKNGSYGIYPVGCTDVLVEHCEIFGSSDAGAYVGQSKNIIVRNNYVHDNVAGIEIENSTDADVYENLCENNTGGILIFDLPDLPVKNGSRCRVFNNRVINNNVKNFGVKGTVVAEIPAGTGLIVMATNDCQVFNNEIKGHNTISAAVISYEALQKPYKDSIYDPYCGGIAIFDNRIERGNGKPDASVAFGQLFIAMFGDKIPEIVYDGSVNPKYLDSAGNLKPEHRICIRNNGKVEFVNLDLANKGKGMSRDASKMDCTLNPLNEVKLAMK